LSSNDIAIINRYNDDPMSVLTKLESSYKDYTMMQCESLNGKTRVAARFIELMDSYDRFKNAMREGDPLIIEKENVEWIPRWKATGKPRYFEASMRKIETLYEKVSRPVLEIIRRNRFIRLNEGRRMITFDELCELMNLWMKELMATPFFSTVVKYSEHLSLLRRCGFQTFGSNMLKSSIAPGREKEYVILKGFFERSGLFVDEPFEMTGNAFWKHVLFSKRTPTNDREKRKEDIPLTDHEIELESIFFDLREQEAVPTVELDLQDHEGEVMGATTLEGECDDELFHPETEEERVAALKKLSSVKKYAFNKLALQDMVEYGTMLMGGTIVEERKKAKEKEKRREQHIYDAVRHFREQASKRREILRAVINDDPSGDSDTN
jgi:hypothetical protein